ncbi:cryptochrome/photolyase family protein [Faecalibacter macacae]|uniref:Deoxyribodipyrimidine photo-lyase n=1 Tax=Faecalibacter macacae TaxID=1859289 RepID=A0A3L9M8H2_9FLAO|nr:deoxyribodipyrimidine photo-lyase [Faecalibacter macacae]RLZ09092.1 deoxyribodipyrimidine photo-lyase [Faecalibacter macacae]
MDTINIFWFRRDLRLEDNIGLFHALNQGNPVLPLFIFDTNILDDLNDKYDRRVDYIHQSLENINTELLQLKSSLLIRYGNPIDVLLQLKKEYNIEHIFCNEDYETYGINRDNEVKQHFNLLQFKDHVIFKYDEILKKDNTPYTVFTPYSKQWKLKVTANDYKAFQLNLESFYPSNFEFPTLESIGFHRTDIEFSEPSIPLDSLHNYKETRDIPSLDSTSKLSLPLRFGTISIRKCVRIAIENNLETWLNELIWRDFFIQILAHFPYSAYSAFKPKYDHISWRNNENEFELWCKGETGYPIVDAGMKELNATGFMHNRVRMIVASFLCKHLLIDWRWGESYFAKKLNDYEMASNVGNWQWASSSGCDATPYFRVFNPTLQQQKFDKDFKYIKKWIPNFEENNYIEPIVPHDFARQRAISTYKEGLNN